MEDSEGCVLQVQLVGDEMNLVRRMAETAGLSPESFARTALMGYCTEKNLDAALMNLGGPDPNHGEWVDVDDDDDDSDNPTDNEPWRPRPGR